MTEWTDQTIATEGTLLLAGIRSRLTYANVASSLALFLALSGGVAFAVTQLDANSVKSKHIVNGQVKVRDLIPTEDWIPLPLYAQNGEVQCHWTNYGGDFADAAYFRDREGVVHLRGLVRANDGTVLDCGATSNDVVISTSLPLGYGPEDRTIFTISSNQEPGRVDVAPEGTVEISPDYPTYADAETWVQLDGISFRCDAPSDKFGCP